MDPCIPHADFTPPNLQVPAFHRKMDRDSAFPNNYCSLYMELSPSLPPVPALNSTWCSVFPIFVEELKDIPQSIV